MEEKLGPLRGRENQPANREAPLGQPTEGANEHPRRPPAPPKSGQAAVLRVYKDDPWERSERISKHQLANSSEATTGATGSHPTTESITSSARCTRSQSISVSSIF